MRNIIATSLIVFATTLALPSCCSAADPPTVQVEQRLVVGGQGYFPVAQRLQDGRIAVVLRGGATHVGIKGRLDMVFSSDEGKTWSPPTVVYDSPDDDRNPSFGQSKDGALVVGFWRAKRDTFKDYQGESPDHPVSTWVTRSTDGGKTWGEAVEIDVREIGYGSPYGKILTLADGTMLMNIYGYGVRAAGEKVDHSHLYRSTDGGKTWQRHGVIGKGFNETGLLALPDGTLLAAMRSAGKKANVWLARSSDGGKSWSEPEEISQASAHPADLTRLLDGRILMVTGFRAGPFGVAAVIGDATGHFDWSLHFPLVSDSTQIDTGYPSSVVLSDGRVVTVYYAVGSKTHPEWGTHCGVAEYRPAPQ